MECKRCEAQARRIDEQESETASLKDQLVSSLAETENIRRRLQRTTEQMQSMDRRIVVSSGGDGLTQFENLDSAPDESLRAVIAQAGAILKGRAQESRRDALAAIKRLARENGLDVSVVRPKRKRGRPAGGGPA